MSDQFVLSEITDTKSIVIPWCINNGTITTYQNTFEIPEITFQPDFAVIRQVVCTSGGVNDNNIYVVRSDLTDNNILTFCGQPSSVLTSSSVYMSNPQTLIQIKKPLAKFLNFYITAISNTTATLNSLIPIVNGVTNIGATGIVVYLTINIDFIKVLSDNGPNNIHDQKSFR